MPTGPVAQAPAGGQGRGAAVAAEVLERVRTEGAAPVIIQVTTGAGFRPEGALAAAEAQQQRADIVRAQNGVAALLASVGVGNAVRFTTIPFLAARVNAAALAALQASPLVVSIEEDSVAAPTLAESIPLIRANSAWSSGYSGDGWAVAVLDTGVEKTHAFLSGKVVSEACYSNAGGSGGGTAVCPGGVTASTAEGSGVPCGSDCSHGTHVAGIAAGRGESFSGTARDATVISIQVFTRFSDGISAYFSDINRALERVYELRTTRQIAAVNLSLGGLRYYSTSSCDTAHPSTKAAIDNLRSVGIAVVISSGNNSWSDSLSAPGCLSSAVSVGSTTKLDGVSSFSNSASFLSLLAPGSSIYASVLNGGFGYKSGTSMAAPHVAGAWAVLKQAAPAADVPTILNALRGNGKGTFDSRNGLTFSRIDVAAALVAFTCPFDVTPTAFSVGPTVSTGVVTVSVPGGCLWSAQSHASWLTIASGSAGTGSGSVSFEAAKNSGDVRTGTLSVAGSTVTVTQDPLFSDSTLSSGITVVRAVHFTELRSRIDTLRTRYGLAAVSWTDPTITPGVTVVRAVHLTELRAALDAVYAAAGRVAPTYTDSNVAAGVVLIRVAHIQELRNAVAALW